ncbi:hypothetical protein ACFV80_46405 [Streptomyces sp. NPDC059862]|uniref:hypothetical protein n=1 Tax=Streptomyces sp. NPDC059862 TaxID=3346975 RepID=UPI0036656904
MPHPTDGICIPEDLARVVWPAGTESALCTGDAMVLTAAGDFADADAEHVRRQLPARHVTHDGDVITIWPRPRLHR